MQGTVARSRSRYKGLRPHKAPAKPSEPPTLRAEQLQRLHNNALFPREPRPQNDEGDGRGRKVQHPLYENAQRHRGSADSTQRSEASVAEKGGSLGKGMKRTTSQGEVFAQAQTPQGYQQNCLEEAGQDTTPRQKLPTFSLQHTRNPGSELRSPHKEKAPTTVRSPALPRSGLAQRIADHSNGERLRKSREELKRTISAPIAIETPSSSAKPAFDAPVSAVNAGERRVSVKYDQTLMSLPVMPSTTPLDIIRSAADQLAEPLDPNSTILLESFKQLGLERPLRRYEHVRDVLNSWDNDTQNILIIKPSPAGGKDDLLDLHSVSSSQPVGTSVYVHYSQRPGHWDKRWVTLRSDGQMLIAKGEDRETANICHISDFDIYIPTARQSTKRIRPPRKMCFAVKSQQKSSMFLSTANYVHFFSTSDKTLAASWYKAVLEWRSWYLVIVMGKGKEVAQGSNADTQRVPNTGLAKPESQRKPPEPPSQGMNSTNPNSQHNIAGDTVDDTPYRSRSEFQTPQSKKFSRDADIGAHGPSFVQVVRQEEPEPFAATGLLGRTYTERQRTQREREKVQTATPDHPVAMPNITPVNSLNRMLSQRLKPKPLIDLTPQYQEPPQHAKKGRGVVLKQIPAGGLVEVANTPEAAIPIPPSTTWRRPTSRGGDGPSVARSKTVRRDHSSGAPSEPKQTSTSPGKGGMAFTGGLLASHSIGQGGARTGRGVTTGNRQAKEPMLNVGQERQYAPGSLLERVKRQDQGSHPIIDREKNGETRAAVGEGT